MDLLGDERESHMTVAIFRSWSRATLVLSLHVPNL